MVTACKTREQFIELYHPFCDDGAIFIATPKLCPLGQELNFSIQLADKTKMLGGAGCVEAAFSTQDNRWRQLGMQLRIRRLTANSSALFAKLQLHAAVASIEPIDPVEPIEPRVRFARSGSASGASTTVDDEARGGADDAFQCAIYDAEHDVVAGDEAMIDVANAPNKRGWPRGPQDRKQIICVALAVGLLIMIAAVTPLRLRQAEAAIPPSARPPSVKPKPTSVRPNPTSVPTSSAVAPKQTSASASPEPQAVPTQRLDAAKQCELHVATQPARALVRVDGIDAGAAPQTITTTCGAHDVEVSHRRYATAARSVVLTPERAERVQVTLVRPTHTVAIETTPADAQITISGKLVTSPVKVDGFKTVEITIAKPGWRTITHRLYSKARNDRVVVRLIRQRR